MSRHFQNTDSSPLAAADAKCPGSSVPFLARWICIPLVLILVWFASSQTESTFASRTSDRGQLTVSEQVCPEFPPLNRSFALTGSIVRCIVAVESERFCGVTSQVETVSLPIPKRHSICFGPHSMPVSASPTLLLLHQLLRL
ncbi:MAG: hypothetical protein R3C11_11060 [Planctomycetaceae bacterium]